MTFDSGTNRLRSNRLVLGQCQPQRILDGILTIAGRQLQDLQIFAGGDAHTVIAEQLIVSHAEVTGGKHVGAILIVLQRSGLANQRLDLIVVHQVTVPRAKLAIFRKVVDRGAEAVAAMLARYAAQFPKGLLQPAADGLERFGKANRHELPIRVREREVIEQMIERLSVKGDSQRVHVGKVRRPQPAWIMHLGKHDGLVGAMKSTPVAYAPLEGPSLRVGKPTGIALLEPGEQRERP